MNSQIFEMEDEILLFEREKSILFCKYFNSKTKWAKKIANIISINEIIEDGHNYYILSEIDDTNGLYVSVNKKNGNTNWEIPGKAYLQIQYNKYLYLIFIDENEKYFLIKVDKINGKKMWHYQVENDLMEYKLTNERMELIYSSGKIEKLSTMTGIKY